MAMFNSEEIRSAATRIGLVLAVLTLALVLDQSGAVDARHGPLGDARVQAELVDLNDLEDLRAQFNEDAGTPRLVVIVSPT